jgi:primosomal protein N' (replication factor Y) (superfamily II helicase)
LYTARRGLSPITLCGDCGTTVICKECGASVVLHKGTEENYFLCHACGTLRHARERCVVCQSWRLEAFGVGTELVADEVQVLFPDTTVHTLSSDTVKTHNATARVIDAFLESRRSVLVTTELALPYLSRPVPLVGVVSLDSLLSLSSWNVYEKVSATLTRLHEIAGTELILQTRHPDTDILTNVLMGNFSSYYRTELRARKQMGYPPYTVLIKVSAIGTESDVTARIADAVERLQPYELIPFSRMLRAPGGKYSHHAFLRITRENWPDPVLLQKLRALSPSYTVMVDPDSIL